ncbi:uncharacterized protein LOC119105580 [Pollicipes pollicipes]|uniref:uncharacterized protein LOC119105580 n=1 Tax=Pollicipes pollicipes TaxID=41117 RepID=UPI001884B54B|nr:uncharacterized protein LOC119105580 [Pollicipes pollicipes]
MQKVVKVQDSFALSVVMPRTERHRRGVTPSRRQRDPIRHPLFSDPAFLTKAGSGNKGCVSGRRREMRLVLTRLPLTSPCVNLTVTGSENERRISGGRPETPLESSKLFAALTRVNSVTGAENEGRISGRRRETRPKSTRPPVTSSRVNLTVTGSENEGCISGQQRETRPKATRPPVTSSRVNLTVTGSENEGRISGQQRETQPKATQPPVTSSRVNLTVTGSENEGRISGQQRETRRKATRPSVAVHRETLVFVLESILSSRQSLGQCNDEDGDEDGDGGLAAASRSAAPLSATTDASDGEISKAEAISDTEAASGAEATSDTQAVPDAQATAAYGRLSRRRRTRYSLFAGKRMLTTWPSETIWRLPETAPPPADAVRSDTLRARLSLMAQHAAATGNRDEVLEAYRAVVLASPHLPRLSWELAVTLGVDGGGLPLLPALDHYMRHLDLDRPGALLAATAAIFSAGHTEEALVRAARGWRPIAKTPARGRQVVTSGLLAVLRDVARCRRGRYVGEGASFTYARWRASWTS